MHGQAHKLCHRACFEGDEFFGLGCVTTPSECRQQSISATLDSSTGFGVSTSAFTFVVTTIPVLTGCPECTFCQRFWQHVWHGWAGAETHSSMVSTGTFRTVMCI